MDEMLMRLFAEAPLAVALWQAARLLAPVLAEHLRQQRAIVTRLTEAVETMSGRLDKLEGKVDSLVEAEHADA